MSDPIKYFILAGEEQKGPYTLAQLQAMWRTGSLTVDNQYWFEGQSEWLPLGTILELLEQQERTRPTQAYFTAPPFAAKGVQTIEATAKKWKAAQLISGLVMCVGVVVALVIPLLGVLMVVVGLFALIGAKIGAWWHHG